MRTWVMPKILVLVAVVVGLAVVHSRAALAASASELNKAAESALAQLYAETPEAKTFADKAKGMLVFPKITKAGLIVGGSGGDGVLMVDAKPVTYHSTLAGSIGLQAGYEEYAMVMMFMTPDSLAKFQNSSGWEVGVDAGVTVIDKGAAGSLSIADLSKNPVVAFIFGQEGLMAGISLEGAKISRIENMEP